MRKGTKALFNRLREELPSLMCFYSPLGNMNYECTFCHTRVAMVLAGDQMPHKDDCLGKALERELSNG